MAEFIVEVTEVRVMPFAGYKNKYVNEIGTVEKAMVVQNHGHKIGVRLNSRTNGASKYGLFWFDADKLEVIENYESEEERIMLKGFKVAGISFLEGSNTDKVYSYALYGDEIKVDDIVVVQSGHHGLGVGKVVCINDESAADSVQCSREVIAKVDFTAFNERKAKEEKLIKLKREMDKKVKELQHFAIYEMLAKEDPALKEMLDEFKSLSE